MRKTVAAALVLVTLAGCGGNPPLAERDPAGAEACEKLAFYLERENPEVALGGMLVVGEAASLADTKEIYESAEKMGTIDFWLVDQERMHAACEAEDVEMPPLPSKGGD